MSVMPCHITTAAGMDMNGYETQKYSNLFKVREMI